MIDCIIGSWDAVLKISARGPWDEGMIAAITPTVRDIDLSIIAMICNNIVNAKHTVFG